MNAMNLVEMLMNSQNSGAVQKAGANVGLDASQSQSAITALLPAISSALKQNASSPQGLAGLLSALQNGNHSQYLDNPAKLESTETVTDGNAILGHLFGSKEVSRAVAGKAAEQTGLNSDTLKKFLPLVATLAMGSLSKQTQGDSSMKSSLASLAASQLMGGQTSGGLGGMLSGLLGGKKKAAAQQQANHQQGLGMLGKMLDADGDGSVMDDLLKAAMNKR